MTEELFVYSDRLDYEPGDEVRLYASASKPMTAEASLVQPIASGDTEKLDYSYRSVTECSATRVSVDFQKTFNGSFGVVEGVSSPGGSELTMAAYVWPTRPAAAGQHILAWEAGGGRFEISLNEQGLAVAAYVEGDNHVADVQGHQPLAERQWYLLAVTVSLEGISLVQIPIASTDPADTAQRSEGTGKLPSPLPASHGALLIATRALDTAPDGSPRTDASFDGKIDSPALLTRSAGLESLEASDHNAPRWLEGSFASWDFGSNFSSDVFHARQEQPSGRLFNAPARGMTGRNWTGDYLDFRVTPEQYGAVHFHSDDLEDAAWQETTAVHLPDDLPSGIYALRVEGERAEDHVPIFVGPSPDQDRADVLFLAPTFSYIAYANSRLAEELDYSDDVLTDLDVKKQFRDNQVYEHREFGMSLYDHHVDGSGNCYSTHLRPIPNMRWDFRSGLQSAPRHFAADIAWPGWFETKGIFYDVLADHALQGQGTAALEGYKIVITGSHPEYWSGTMLDAVEEYLEGGGSLAYVGGNGFYWVTSSSRGRPHLVEVRRGQQGIRTWEGQPGEGVSTQSSEPGGLWRLRGRAPNRLVGVGMAAQGWDRSTPGFERTPESRDQRVADLFAGIGEEEIIGDFGLVLGGAAGDEIDRADVRLGSPRHALVVATSQPHSKYYLAANEELQTPTPHINGSNNPNVRADISFYEHRGGGFVVSTSGITWTGSMAYRKFDNNVSRFMENVVVKALKE